ncbi:MAG: glycosyltransferase, partial [Rhodothermales bacterium]|nr:glycosyltransferase [Rhodothermales bacterium]
MSNEGSQRPLYIAQISIHGLVRGTDLELGRDADTGGQVQYVIDLSRRLAMHPEVDRVDLFTRQILDAKVSPDYAVPEEELGPGAQIIRLPCGPRRYFRKEVLWPYLDTFVDQLIGHVRAIGRTPDVVHGHYADGGYVGSRVAGLLGVPFIYTGHSLGRVKRRYLLEQGRDAERIDAYFHLPERIEAEEEALDAAAAVVTSTQHEIDNQYVLYDHYKTGRKVVIPPGT